MGTHFAAAAPAGGPRGSQALIVFTLVASIGGFLFGFDTGVISGALPYIRDDILRQYAGDAAALAHWQELIVSAAIVAAGFGSVGGGWLADRVGRKRALLLADVLFTAGALAMAAAPDQFWLIAGRALVGLGVGIASVTVPVYIAESVPPARRASLVTLNVLAITFGQFISYVSDYAFTFVGGWRCMLGVAALPALVQLFALLLLPESPKWLASKGRTAAAQRALHRLQPGAGSAVAAVTAAGLATAGLGGPSGSGSGNGGCGRDAGSADGVSGASGTSGPAAADQRSSSAGGGDGGACGASTASSWRLLRSRAFLKQLHLGVGLQILQQVAGINTVMYYTPTILQLAGVQNQTALLLSMLPAATNALGTFVGMRICDRHTRRRLLLTSIAAVVLALTALGSAFLAAERHSPSVLPGGSSSCEGTAARGGVLPDCSACLGQGCGFCGGTGSGGNLLAPGICLALDQQQAAAVAARAEACPTGRGQYQLYLHGCPSSYQWVVLGCLILYLAAFAPGLGSLPWVICSEIFPQNVRGVATGLAATANWVSNAVVAQTFLTLTRRVGGSGAFYLYAAIASVGFAWTYAFLPETNGLSLEQVQQLFAGDASSDGSGGSGGGSSGSGGGGGGLLWGGRDLKRRSSDDGPAEGQRHVGPGGS